MKRDAVVIDFHEVPPHQAQIDARLCNWAAWCRDGRVIKRYGETPAVHVRVAAL